MNSNQHQNTQLPNRPRRLSQQEAIGGDTGQELDDAAYRHALDHGPSAPLEVYRHAYATIGLPWPGDEHARRLHTITDHRPQTPIRPSIQQLSWQGTQCTGAAPSHDEHPALQRLADTFGWDHVPQISEAEQQQYNLELHTALVQARRFYHQDTDDFERGWDAALEVAIETVTGARDGDQAQQRLQRLLHTHTGPEDEPEHQQHRASD